MAGSNPTAKVPHRNPDLFEHLSFQQAVQRTVRGTLLAILCATLVATLPGQDARFFKTADGSPFLLVPIDHHVVTWVNLQPAFPNEEPAGRQGLAMAIAQASLKGGASYAATDDSPLSWEKALRGAPASASKLVQAPGYTGVLVEFPQESFRLVAQLLRVRTARQKLLGVNEIYQDVIQRRNAAVNALPAVSMMRRLLNQFEITRQRGARLAPSSSAPLKDAEIEAFYRRAYDPARSLNVITGNFPIESTEKILREVFRGGRSKPAETNQPNRAVPAQKVPDPNRTMLVGCPLPEKIDAETVVAIDLLVEYLAGDADSFLTDHLRATGHPHVAVRALAPFPETGGIFMIAITDPAAVVKEDSLLVVHLEQALAKVATEPPDQKRLARAIAALRARRSATLKEPSGLAYLLIRRWARGGEVPQVGLAEEGGVSAARFQQLAREVFALESQVLVLPEKPR